MADASRSRPLTIWRTAGTVTRHRDTPKPTVDLWPAVGVPSSRHVVNPGATFGHSKEGRMTATTAEPVSGQRGFSSLIHRQLATYPNTGARVTFLAITVIATITLYYELYVGGSVATLILPNLGMSFTFYV